MVKYTLGNITEIVGGAFSGGEFENNTFHAPCDGDIQGFQDEVVKVLKDKKSDFRKMYDFYTENDEALDFLGKDKVHRPKQIRDRALGLWCRDDGITKLDLFTLTLLRGYKAIDMTVNLHPTENLCIPQIDIHDVGYQIFQAGRPYGTLMETYGARENGFVFKFEDKQGTSYVLRNATPEGTLIDYEFKVKHGKVRGDFVERRYGPKGIFVFDTISKHSTLDDIIRMGRNLSKHKTVEFEEGKGLSIHEHKPGFGSTPEESAIIKAGLAAKIIKHGARVLKRWSK